ncbi:Poly(A) polymerase type 3 [Metarhizium acridum CQMa 102]|uniref:polynucleotide adenylyltransferase n=1 Tax=Metarhizium acridum (strain CQMa 102) TaxID=655827 RepID=E9EGX0_METAQ|nr:Poly(A) polymerase type 3 [Metarhizium acridum CQMa 102]EFY84832.1 Poly(A) polymerase type 3 [Metarhizium acridum CQMa 102]
MAKYGIAHLLLKAWAKSRGLYSSKLGLLGSLNISVMLVPICKLLAYDGPSAGTTDILTTFFHHYRNFDWKTNMVLDPLFHGTVKYHRTQRESMCLLGWHTPSRNTALNATASTIHILSAEIMRASDLLSQEGVNWDTFLRGTQSLLPFPELTACNAAGFLDSHKCYIKMNASYLGCSPRKGKRFVGWLESRCLMVLVDLQPWKDDNAGYADSGEDSELDDNESDDGKEEPEAGTTIFLAPPSSDPAWRNVSPSVLKAGGSGKLRTAADVMNRLR